MKISTIDRRAPALMEKGILFEYLGALEADPGHAAFLLRSALESKQGADSNGYLSLDEAAKLIDQDLDTWEFQDSWTVQYGYTSRITVFERDGLELTIRQYTHDGLGEEAGKNETSVWITPL